MAEANDIIGCQEYNRLHKVCSVFHMTAFMGVGTTTTTTKTTTTRHHNQLEKNPLRRELI